MAKFGFDERRLFNISDEAFENLVSTPSDAASGQMLAYIKSDHLFIKKPTVSEVLIPENGTNLGTGASVFKQKNSSAILEFRKIKNLDGFIDITENADDITLAFDFTDVNDNLDHGLLQGLADDDHLQYLLLAGRSGGQVANGGTLASNNLTLRSTAHATKGSVKIDDLSKFEFNDTTYSQHTASSSASTAVDTTVFSVAVSELWGIEVEILGRRTDVGNEFGSVARYVLHSTVKRGAAGNASLIGSNFQNYKAEDGTGSGSMDSDIILSTNDVQIRVQGHGSGTETFNWKFRIKRMKLG